MAKQRRPHPKAEALARDGALNPQPEAVRDPLFLDSPFFDADDLVQVRYEMVRRHQVDRMAISDVASLFGVSRPTFYKAQSALAAHGLAGLIPRQRGPKGGHKLSAEVLAYIDQLKATQPDITVPQCVDAIAARFGVQSAPTQSGAGRGAQKKTARSPVTIAATSLVDAYEQLRAVALGAQPISGSGLPTLRRQGMAAWIRAASTTPDLTPPCPRWRPPAAGASATSELTLILASLVAMLAAEPTHA